MWKPKPGDLVQFPKYSFWADGGKIFLVVSVGEVDGVMRAVCLSDRDESLSGCWYVREPAWKELTRVEPKI